MGYLSTREQFWPILCQVVNIKDKAPLIVGLYLVTKKPPLYEYLTQFVDELSNLLINGIWVVVTV